MADVDATTAAGASGDSEKETAFYPDYRVAELPAEEVEKLQGLEEEIRNDTGDEVVLIAYEKGTPSTGA